MMKHPNQIAAGDSLIFGEVEARITSIFLSSEYLGLYCASLENDINPVYLDRNAKYRVKMRTPEQVLKQGAFMFPSDILRVLDDGGYKVVPK